MIIKKYRCFTRNWWKEGGAGWPNGLEPEANGRRTFRGTFLEESAAREYCSRWNSTHEPGRLSNKCEYEEIRKRGKHNAFLGREI